MSGFGTVQLSSTTLTTGQMPVPSVAVPNEAGGNLTALEGGPESTDTNGNKTAPASMYVKDGGDVTQGTSTDAAGHNSVIGQLKQIEVNTASVTVGTLPAIPPGSNTIGDVGLVAGSAVIGGVELVDSGGTNKASISAGGAVKVDGSAVTQPVSGNVSVSNFPATQPVSGTVTSNAGTNLNTSLLALESGGNLASANTHLANIDTDSASIVTNTSSTATSTSTIAGAVSGGKMQVSVASALPAGSNTIGAVMQASGPWTMQTEVGTSGGSTPYHNVVSSGTNGTNVKGSAGQVYDGSISNTSASAVYFRFYDTSGSPTVGTTTVKRTIQVPGNGTVIFSWPNGLKFTSGIAWGITTAIADADTTAIGSAVSIDFGYA